MFTRNKLILPCSTAFIAGILLAIMVYFNGALADATTIYYGSLYFHGIGTIVFLILAYIIFPIKNSPSHIKYLLPGIMNAFVIMGSSLIIIKVGVTVMVSISLLGQMLTGIIIDYIVLDNFSIKKLLGVVFIWIGLIIYSSKKHSRSCAL